MEFLPFPTNSHGVWENWPIKSWRSETKLRVILTFFSLPPAQVHLKLMEGIFGAWQGCPYRPWSVCPTQTSNPDQTCWKIWAGKASALMMENRDDVPWRHSSFFHQCFAQGSRLYRFICKWFQFVGSHGTDLVGRTATLSGYLGGSASLAPSYVRLHHLVWP